MFLVTVMCNKLTQNLTGKKKSLELVMNSLWGILGMICPSLSHSIWSLREDNLLGSHDGYELESYWVIFFHMPGIKAGCWVDHLLELLIVCGLHSMANDLQANILADNAKTKDLL